MKKVILMLAVAAMASCSKSELTERPMPVGDVAIVAGSSVVSVDSRAPFEGTLDDEASKTLTAYVYATKLDVDNSNAYVSYAAANLAAQGYMTFVSASDMTSSKYPVAAVGFQKYNTDATPALVADPQYYPSNDNPLYMVGLVPASTTDWTLDSDAKNADYMIDGKTDIMAAAVTTMNDGSSAIKKTTATATVYPAFNFKHKLTLVNVKAYTPTKKEQAAFGKITKIELIAVNGVIEGVNNKCTVKLEDASATWTGAATGTTTLFYAYDGTDYSDLQVSTDDEKTSDAKVYNGAVEIAAPADESATAFTSSDAEYVAYAMVAPFDAVAVVNSKNLKLKVYTEENTDGLEATVTYLYNSKFTTGSTDYFSGSTEGKKFDVTLKFAGKEIEASATVTDWEEKYVEDVEVI